MDTFLQLNRNKLKGLFIRISLAIIIVVSIVLVIAFFTGNWPIGQLLVSIVLVAGIGFPLFIMVLGYIVWSLNRRLRLKAFSKTPFNLIKNIGFYKAYVGENSKWALTEEIKEGKLNDFVLRMNLSKEKRHHIEFEIPVEWKRLEKNEYNTLSEKFKQYNAEFRIGSIVKLYDLRQQTSQTIFDIKKDLEIFTALLKQEGFKSKV